MTDDIPSSSVTFTSNFNVSSMNGLEGDKLRFEISGLDEVKLVTIQVSAKGSLVSSCPVIPLPPDSDSSPSLFLSNLASFSFVACTGINEWF